jgi:NAD(P)-dependent dehydrogenase (short-subunit alcohol dehydrogenase family)
MSGRNVWVTGDLNGKVALVTGSTSGLGLETAVALAVRGCHVVLTGRTMERLANAKAVVLNRAPATVEAAAQTAPAPTAAAAIAAAPPWAFQVTCLQVDMASLQSVRDLAAAFLRLNLPLHLLINNAGIMGPEYTASAEGFESQFAVNHLAHFLLTALLLPKLIESAPSRIVNVSSTMMSAATVSEADPTFNLPPQRYSRVAAYGNSKLANALHAAELASRLGRNGVRNVGVFSLHPGVFRSEIGRSWSLISCFHAICGCCLSTADQAAHTVMHCVLDPGLESRHNGAYFFNSHIDNPPNPLARSDRLGQRLWADSERMTNSGPVLPPLPNPTNANPTNANLTSANPTDVNPMSTSATSGSNAASTPPAVELKTALPPSEPSITKPSQPRVSDLNNSFDGNDTKNNVRKATQSAQPGPVTVFGGQAFTATPGPTPTTSPPVLNPAPLTTASSAK